MEADLVKRIFKTVFITVFMTAIIMILGLINQSIVGKNYGPIGIGIYATSLMIIRFLVLFSLFGLPIAFSRWVAQVDEINYKKRISSNFTFLIIYSSLSTLCILIILLFSKEYINLLLNVDWGSSEYLLIGLATLMYGYARISQTMFEGMIEPIKSSIINISLLIGIFVALIYSIFFKLIDIFYIVISGFVLMGFISLFIVTLNSMWSPRVKDNNFKELLIFSSPVTFVIFLSFLGQWSDRLILNQSLGLKEVGIYTAALSIFEAARKVPMSLGPVLMPIYSKLGNQDNTHLENGFNKTMNFNFVFLLFVASIIFVNADYLLILIYSEDFEQGILILKILALQIPLSAFTMSTSSLINGINKPKLNSYISINGLIVQLVFLLALTHFFGLIGTALAQVLSSVMNILFIYWIFNKYVNVKVNYLLLLKPFILFFVITIAFIILQRVSPIDSFIHMIIQVIISFALLWVWILNPLEKKRIKSFMKLENK